MRLHLRFLLAAPAQIVDADGVHCLRGDELLPPLDWFTPAADFCRAPAHA